MCTLTCEYLREFLKKFEITLGYFQGLGGRWFIKKSWSKKISWHCPFNENFLQETVEQVEQVKETEEEKVEKAALFLVETPANQMYVTYTVKKVTIFPVPSRDVTNQTFPGQEL